MGGAGQAPAEEEGGAPSCTTLLPANLPSPLCSCLPPPSPFAARPRSRRPPQHGKLAFGSIYGVFLMGCFGVYVVLSLLSQNKEIGFFSVVSIMGYGLLPIIVLATIAVVLSMRGYLGLICATLAMLWSTYTSSRFFEKAMAMYEHRLIIAYPVGLFYASFILLTIF